MKRSLKKKRYSKKRYPRKRNSKRKSIKKKSIKINVNKTKRNSIKKNTRRKKYSRKTLLRKKYIYSKKNLKGGALFGDDDQYFRIYMGKEDDSGRTIIIPGLIFEGTSDLKSLKSIRGKLDKVLRIQNRTDSLKTKMLSNSDNHGMPDFVDIPVVNFDSFKFLNNDEDKTLINDEDTTNLENILKVNEKHVGNITGSDLLARFDIQEENLRQNEVIEARKVAAAEAKREAAEVAEEVAEEKRVEAEEAEAERVKAEADAEAGVIEYAAALEAERVAAATAAAATAAEATAAEEKARAEGAEEAEEAEEAEAEEEVAAAASAAEQEEAEKGATTKDLLQKLKDMRIDLETRIEENKNGQNQVIALNKQVRKLGNNGVLLQKAKAETEAAVTVAETAEKAKVAAEAEAVKAREAASAASTEKVQCLLKIQTLERQVETMEVNTAGQGTLSCVVEVEEATEAAEIAKQGYLTQIEKLEGQMDILRKQMNTGEKVQYTKDNEFITKVINALMIS